MYVCVFWQMLTVNGNIKQTKRVNLVFLNKTFNYVVFIYTVKPFSTNRKYLQ